MFGVKKNIDLGMYEDMIQVHAEKEDLAFHGHLHFPLMVSPRKAKAEFSNSLLRSEVPLREEPKPSAKIEIR
ncbi:MAG: hypothetical protein ACE5L6_03540 [Candidatus Bathyarchaeia archaeon]